MRKIYNKLVRDKIPGIIRADGGKPNTRILSDEEYLAALVAKLREEVEEFAYDHSLEELADIQEVVNGLLEAIGKTAEELEAVRQAKAAKNGGFTKRIFLERVES